MIYTDAYIVACITNSLWVVDNSTKPLTEPIVTYNQHDHDDTWDPDIMSIHCAVKMNFGLDRICLLTAHVLQDIIAVLHM